MKFNFVLYDLDGNLIKTLYYEKEVSTSTSATNQARRLLKNNPQSLLIVYPDWLKIENKIPTYTKNGLADYCKRCGNFFVHTNKYKNFCPECYDKTHEEKVCPICGKTFSIRYQDYTCCSKSCARKLSTPFRDPEVLKKIARTNLEKYGVENPFNNPDIQKKAILNRDEEKRSISLKKTLEEKYKESRRIKNLKSGNPGISHKEMILLDRFKSNPNSRTFNVIQGKTFDNCVFKNKLRFDFYFPEYFNKEFNMVVPPLLLEYDGAQHYKPIRFNKISDSQMYKNFISCQVKDWYKDLFAITNNIGLIRIHDSKGNTFEDIYQNSYLVGTPQGSDQYFEAFDVIKQDCINNGKSITYLIESGVKCTFKCDKESKSQVCQNYSLCKTAPKVFMIKNLINDYLSQNLSKSITFQGLEPLDSLKQHLWFIYHFRKICNDPIYLWTGYTEEECDDLIYLINKMKWENIIIKFGRFIPNDESHLDPVLGVELKSKNQYAKKIS